jgi:hypothetical protein
MTHWSLAVDHEGLVLADSVEKVGPAVPYLVQDILSLCIPGLPKFRPQESEEQLCRGRLWQVRGAVIFYMGAAFSAASLLLLLIRR